MKSMELKVGDVVQIDPEHDDVFGGCLMIVTDPKSWGAQGGVIVPKEGGRIGGDGLKVAYYRCAFKDMEFVGSAIWLLE